MLNDEMVITTASQFASGLRSGESMFVRPTKDLKSFPGGVVTGDTVEKWLAGLEDTSVRVAASRPREIIAEYRLFIVGGRIITGSQYKANGRLYSKRIETSGYEPFEMAVNGWLPMDTCVMDMALTPEGEYRVVEFNCINCSGFYDHDLKALVTALTEHTDKRK